MTMRINIGEFEELALLMVGILQEEAYGVAIMEEIELQTGRKVNISAIHSALYRLEDKGYLSSRMGEVSATRGGKRKRKFTISSIGKKVLEENLSLREKMYKQIPEIALI